MYILGAVAISAVYLERIGNCIGQFCELLSVSRRIGVDFMYSKSSSTGVIRMLKRTFHRYRRVITKRASTLWTDDGSRSPRFSRMESVNYDVFDPVSVVTRTAAIPVPVARSCPWFVGIPCFRWVLVHLVTPRIIGTV